MSKDTLEKIIDETINMSYKKKDKLSVRNRYKLMNDGFNKIMKHIDENYQKEAISYYKKRSLKDKKLNEIQSEALIEIKNCLKQSLCNKNIEYDIIPASSFTAKTNLIGESDLDFLILVKKINDDKAICFGNALGNCKYILSEIRNKKDYKKKHWVFQKYINNVEIEGKVRDKDGFKEMLKMHNYTDKMMSSKDKILTTYTKFLLKESKKYYPRFKMIYYCSAGYHGKSNELLYPLL